MSQIVSCAQFAPVDRLRQVASWVYVSERSALMPTRPMDCSTNPPDRSRARPGPQRTIADLVEALRRQTKHGPARLAADLQRLHGITVAPATAHRILVRRGLNRLRDLDPPTGEQLREIIRYEHDRVGDMVQVDIKKLGRIPTGGGWRMHGVGTDAARASKRLGPGTGKVGYTYLHTAIDDHFRLAYSEALEDERAVTAAAFWHRAVAFFAAHDITPIHRVLTDNGSCYRSRAWAAALATTKTKHKRTRPYTPADEREGRTLQRDPGARVGLRPRLRLRARTPRRTRGLPQLLQPRGSAHRPRLVATDQPNFRQRLPRHLRPAAGTTRHPPSAS
ncbi:hypothetical protein QFZ22_000792 [Streptomyces canus]|uniref:Integrase catalytic domain-containing protein n=1 Tax=Streptomyces canus TaxID=58343 RepID=A0AAW8F7W7_9ACTN|nr:DDE-type integrase/transposase/recombinase [Streptomyces canus]MDQ0904807.1 hypothetical protein [Streptomyces canus]